ncbi:MAG: hypothetical protein IPK44_25070 [Candidatus Accumulibacter sp.]|uniref:hypothetical protein n=1 Tax=Accumulibacter sp. TaxID=2053492 RepID=UPI0025878626|nr:hypothetical protein [Accumulibacter sp.]MBK8117562.1 hypothetical protein [Accumulibacter sp.]
MGLRTDGDTVGGRMLDKGFDPLKVDEIRPHLRAGFDAAHKEAQARARDAKATWRAITGETYGNVKAATWKANKPAHDGNRVRLEREELTRVAEQIERGAADLAVMQSAATRQAQASEKSAGLRETRRAVCEHRGQTSARRGRTEKWQAKVEHEARKSGKQMPAEPTTPARRALPSCATTTPTGARRVRAAADRQPTSEPGKPPNTSAHATCWRDRSRTTSATSRPPTWPPNAGGN